MSGVAAARFASQLNENAKYPAIAGLLPEVTHNQIGVFDGPFVPDPSSAEPSALTALRLVLLVDAGTREHNAIADLAAQRGIAISEIGLTGEHPLVRLAMVVQLADYASVYLGIASGIDPGQADVIRDLPAAIE